MRLETARLVIRSFAAHDAEPWIALVNDPEVGRFTEQGPESPCFQAGDEWPTPLAGFSPVCENNPGGHLHLSKPNRVCGFRATSVARVKALPYGDTVRSA
jgi:hypothetical protein